MIHLKKYILAQHYMNYVNKCPYFLDYEMYTKKTPPVPKYHIRKESTSIEHIQLSEIQDYEISKLVLPYFLLN